MTGRQLAEFKSYKGPHIRIDWDGNAFVSGEAVSDELLGKALRDFVQVFYRTIPLARPGEPELTSYTGLHVHVTKDGGADGNFLGKI